LAIYSESCVKIYRCQFCHVLARFSHRHYMCPSVRPSVCLSVRLSQASSRLILFMDVSLVATMHLRRFTTWTIRYLDCLLPGRFATWTVCYLDDSLPGLFATWTIRHLDDSPTDVSHLWTFQYHDVSLPPCTFRHLYESL